MLGKTKQLILYEVNETSLRPFIAHNEKEQTDYLHKLKHIELIYHHLQNICMIKLDGTAFSAEEKCVIQTSLKEMAAYFLANEPIHNESIEELQYLMNAFWRSNHEKETFSPSLLPDELIILYEIISVYALIQTSLSLESFNNI